MDHNSYSLEGLAETLKKARLAHGLSQRALSAKIGVPQGHISKIESGQVDLKASSLIELARALGLELMLVPRSLVPVVSSFARQAKVEASPIAGEDSSVSEVKDELAKVQKEAARVTKKIGAVPELTRLSEAARELVNMRVGLNQAMQIQETLKGIRIPRETINEVLRARTQATEMFKSLKAQGALKDIAFAAESLKDIRNALAHGAMRKPAKALPAYRLSDGDDDA